MNGSLAPRVATALSLALACAPALAETAFYSVRGNPEGSDFLLERRDANATLAGDPATLSSASLGGTSVAYSEGVLYVGGDGVIHRVGPDLSPAAAELTVTGEAVGLDVHEATDTIFYASGSSVRRIGTDGSGDAEVVAPTGAAGALRVDDANDKLYFLFAELDSANDVQRNRLFVSDLDGSNLSELHEVESPSGSGALTTLAIDPADNVVLYTDRNAIYRGPLDLSTAPTLVVASTGFSMPDGLTFDPNVDRFCWSAVSPAGAHELRCLNGPQLETPGEVEGGLYGLTAIDLPVLTRWSILAPGEGGCELGGHQEATGFDDGAGAGTAADGTLDDDEVTSAEVSCDGPLLVRTTDIDPGDECAAGGVRVDSGLDNGDGEGDAGDGELDDDEVDASSVICNGEAGDEGPAGPEGPDGDEGDDGDDGDSALVAVTEEPAGDNCAEGGQRIDSGVDEDGDGELDEDEIDGTAYVCDGAGGGGAAGVVEIVDLPPDSEDCQAGGVLVRTGLDEDGDGVLDEDEVTDSRPVCNGEFEDEYAATGGPACSTTGGGAHGWMLALAFSAAAVAWRRRSGRGRR